MLVPGMFIIHTITLTIFMLNLTSVLTSAITTARNNFGSNQTIPLSSRNQLNRHIIVATTELAPFMMKQIDGNGSVKWYGYCMEFFEELIKHLPYDLTYDIYESTDGKFGSKRKQFVPGLSNASKKWEEWNGLVGDLHRGIAHVALAPLSIMAEREMVIDFTVPFYDLVGSQILLKKPEVPQDWFKFLTVLDGEVWFSITIAYFLTSFVMFLFDRLSPYSHKNMSRIARLNQRRKIDGDIPNKQPNSFKNSGVTSISNNLNCTDNYNGFGVSFRDDALGHNYVRTKRQSIAPCDRFVRRRSRRYSGPFVQAFDSIFHRRKDSIHPKENLNSKYARDQRGSKTLNDYLRAIDLRRGSTHQDAKDSDFYDSDDGKPDFGFKDSLWFCITSLTPQGGGEAPQNLSGRVVAGAWWLFCFIIIASYTANLAAFLTVSRLDIPIESLDDLAKQYRIKYAPIDGTAESAYFERMAYIEEIFYNIWKDMSLNESLGEEERSKFAIWDYPISDKYTKIWSQIQQVGMPLDLNAGIQRVRSSSLEEGFALITDGNVVKYLVMTDCTLKAVGDEFSRKPISLGIRKGEERLRDDLSHATLQLINQRYMETLREKWWTNNPNRVTCKNNDESDGLSIENIGGVFIIIFAGITLSFLVWAIERFAYKTKVGISQDLIQRL